MTRAADLFRRLDRANDAVNDVSEKLWAAVGYEPRIALADSQRLATDARTAVKAELHALLKDKGPLVWRDRIYFHSVGKPGDVYSYEFRHAEECDDDRHVPQAPRRTDCARCGCGYGAVVAAEAACG